MIVVNCDRMKIIVIGDRSSKKLKYISDAVVIAALEKHISCEPMDISDVRIDPSRASSPEYIRSFSQLLREEGADAVLCTTQGGMKLMSALRALEGSSPLICCIISDYSFSAEQFEHTADCYFVPHEEIRSRLIGQGISGDKIFVTGIPVNKNFRERIGKAAARNYLVIPRDRRIYLIIPDGLRAEDIAHLCKELSQSEREDHAVYIPTKRSSPATWRKLICAAPSSKVATMGARFPPPVTELRAGRLKVSASSPLRWSPSG